MITVEMARQVMISAWHASGLLGLYAVGAVETGLTLLDLERTHAGPR